MTPETIDVLKMVFSGAGGITLWKLIENYQKHRMDKDKRADERDDEKDVIIKELRDRIHELEIDNAKKETWLEAFKEELKNGTLAEKIKRMGDNE